MNLKNYVKTLNPVERAAFCCRAHISPSHLSQMISGSRGMSTAMCVKLISVSDGNLTLKELHPERYEEFVALVELGTQITTSVSAAEILNSRQ